MDEFVILIGGVIFLLIAGGYIIVRKIGLNPISCYCMLLFLGFVMEGGYAVASYIQCS